MPQSNGLWIYQDEGPPVSVPSPQKPLEAPLKEVAPQDLEEAETATSEGTTQSKPLLNLLRQCSCAEKELDGSFDRAKVPSLMLLTLLDVNSR